MVTITHTHETGTILEGTRKGDGTAAILKANRWRWGRSIGAWYVPGSRDRMPRQHLIRRTVAALEAAGFEVAAPVIDARPRRTADVEADQAARQAARADALAARAGRKASEAGAAWERHERDLARLPQGGEPIHVGHHSEGPHRAALARAQRSIRHALDAETDAVETARRADVAGHATARRYDPVTVANRIEKIAADLRRLDRSVTADTYDEATGYRPATGDEKARRAAHAAPRRAQLVDQLAYWRQVRAGQIARGEATGYGPDTVHKGDTVKIRGHWYTVARANTKTVSVDTGHSWTVRTPWPEVQDHHPAGQ